MSAHPARLAANTLAALVFVALGSASVHAADRAMSPSSGASPELRVARSEIGGTVSGPHGPEAGVWVIAETHDLPTRFTRTVVTDEQGRYLIPDLPAATYTLWVRGYGLVDSQRVSARTGSRVNLMAVPAPSDADAARYYPAI